MLINQGSALKYLLDYKDGKIKQGLGLDCMMDEYLRFKPKQLNIILGHDNVGKTYWINWYFLALALKHDLKFVIWSGENQHGQVLRDMVQMYAGKPFKELSHAQISTYSAIIEQYFYFVDNTKLYKPNELLDIFAKTDAHACLIDPFTGLDRQMGYEANYRFLNEARQFVNDTKKTIYINTHPNTESGRTTNLFSEKHEWHGHLKPPLKDGIEGGKAFLNRCDDMFVIHRLVKHETMKYYTMISVEKIKDMETGGKHTALNDYILCEYNNGLGFRIQGKDVLQDLRYKEPKQGELIYGTTQHTKVPQNALKADKNAFDDYSINSDCPF